MILLSFLFVNNTTKLQIFLQLLDRNSQAKNSFSISNQLLECLFPWDVPSRVFVPLAQILAEAFHLISSCYAPSLMSTASPIIRNSRKGSK